MRTRIRTDWAPSAVRRPASRLRRLLRRSAAGVAVLAAVVLAGAGLLAACSDAPPGAADGGAAERPHIVVLLADDLGWNDVGYHGGEIATPNIDALAASGARLDALYASPTCTPTRAALMTGRYPMRYGLQAGVLRPHSQRGLALDETLLPELLAAAGYETAICGKWHLGFFERAYLPTERGFEHQYGCYNGAVDYAAKTRLGGIDWHRDDRPLVALEDGRPTLAADEHGYATDLIAREAVRRIERRDPGRPLFLYVPFTAPHVPLQAPAEDLARYEHVADPNRRAFCAMVHRLDACIGAVLAALERTGIRDETLVVFASDNGGDTALGASNAPLSGGKRGLGEGGLRVPGVVAWPGRIAAQVVDEPVSFVDWLPTFARLACAELPDVPLDGVDLVPVLQTAAVLDRDALLLHLAPDRAAVRSGVWKLVKRSAPGEEPSAGSSQVALYNVVEDPAETRNAAGERTELVNALLQRLDGWSRAAAPAQGWPKDPPPTDFRAPLVWGQGR